MVEGDVTRQDDVERAMDGQTFVCHAAALVPGSGASDAEFDQVNVGGTRNVCKAAVGVGVTRLLYVSTAHVFGIRPGATLTERDSPVGLPHPGYDSSKSAAEAIIAEHAANKLDSVIINPAVAFGPRSRHSSRLISLFLKGRLPVLPLPNRTLSLVYSGDVGRGGRLALENGKRGERYILAGRPVQIREFIETLAAVSGRKPPRFSLPDRVVAAAVATAWSMSAITRWRPPVTVSGIRNGGTIYDGGRAERELGLAYTPLDDALRSTVEWLLAHG